MAKKNNAYKNVLDKYKKQASSRSRSKRHLSFHFRHSLWLLTSKSEFLIKRILDFFISLSLLIAIFPLLCLAYISCRIRYGKAFDAESYMGHDGKPFMIYQFHTRAASLGDGAEPDAPVTWLKTLSFYKFPVLFNIFKGNMSFVGPTPVYFSTAGMLPEYALKAVRPGLTNPYALRKAANIAHEEKSFADKEYIHTQSIKGDLGIMVRSLLMLVLGGGKDVTPPPEVNIMDIKIQNYTMQTAVNLIIKEAMRPTLTQFTFVNADCFNISFHHEKYRQLLQRLHFVMADGIGIHLACRILKTSMADNVVGTDLFPYLCIEAEERQVPLFFLGGRDGVAETMVSILKKRYPNLLIAGFQHGFYPPEEKAAVIEKINQSGAKILLVAFGAPQQELWIDEHKEQLSVGVAMGVGGLFDFMSGRIKRAPRWMREIGLEWLYRLSQEPGRMWRRYIIGNPLFLWRVKRWDKKRCQGK